MSLADDILNRLRGAKSTISKVLSSPYSNPIGTARQVINSAPVQRNIVQPTQRYFAPTPQLRTRDIMRELPSATAQTLIGNVPRSFVSLRLKPNQTFQPQTKAQQFFMGTKPITPAKESYFAKKTGIPLLGVAGTIAAGAADITPIGKGKGLKLLAKEGTELGVRKLLGKEVANYGDDVIKAIAKEKNAGKIGKLLKSKLPTGAGNVGGVDALTAEAQKYKSADDFIKAQESMYHGSPVPLKQFSNKKGGVYFTNSMEDASGFAGNPDNVYEGYVKFKKPLVIDAKGAKWNELDNKYGTSTQEIIGNAQKDGYDGIVFKNIVDNQMDTAGIGGETTISYAYKPQDSFLNESQLKEIWKKSQVSTPNVGGEVKTIAPQVPVVQPNIPTETVDPVEKIITALKQTKPLRKEQNVLNAELRKQQYAKLMTTRSKTSGEAGYFSELGALKGGAKKVDFEPVRPSLTQTDIDSLFNKINDANIGDWEKINAKAGLTKLLSKEGATMPTGGELKLMNDVFGREMTNAILSNRTTWQKFLSNAGEVLNLPRALMASFDLSAPLRQGIVMTSRPKQFFPSFVSMFKQAGSDKAFKAVQEQIASRPTYKLMRESKLALTDIGGDLANREEVFMSNLGEKIPVLKYGIKASNRAYTGFLNKLRADVFDDMVSKAKLLGNENPDVAIDIAKFVNAATGRGDLGALNRAAPVLNSIFFSPRLMAARVNMLNPAFYTKLDPMVRKEAVKSMLTMGATAGTVLGLAKAGGANVVTDPKSADFGKIKVGDTRYDILGGFQQYIVLASRLISGKMTSSTTGKEISLTEGYKPTTRLDIIINFLKSKENPILSYLTGALEGTTQLGQQFNPASEAINRFIPMFAQDIVDLTEDKGFAKAIGMELPSAFGVGVQTYGKQIPVMGTTPSGNSTVKWRNPYDIGERIINKVTGAQGSPFTKEQQVSLDQARRKELQLKADTEKAISTVQKQINKGITVKDVTTLPDGRGMYVTDKGIEYADTPEKAQIELNKNTFKKSGKSFEIKDGMVYRKNTLGDVTVTPEYKYNAQLFKAQLTQFKNSNDVEQWRRTAGKLVKNYNEQLQDPSVDELDKVEIQNDLNTLLKSAAKYYSYGNSFTKGSLGKKGKKLAKPKTSKATLKLKAPNLRKIGGSTATKTVKLKLGGKGGRITKARIAGGGRKQGVRILRTKRS